MPKNLLLADDSITIQKVVAITFANEDFKVTSVDNGEDALSRAREIKPDIILADVVMPRRNGYEVCEAVKGDPGLRHIPVLLLAGTFEAFDESRARQARADGHIAKPFESQALINKVKELTGGAKVAAPAGAPAAAPGPARPAPAPGAPAARAPGAGMPPAGPPRPGGPMPLGARPPGPGMPPPGAPRPGAPMQQAGARPPGPGMPSPGAPRPGAPMPLGARPPGAGMPPPGMAPRPPGAGMPPGARPPGPGMPPPGMAPRPPGAGMPPGARPPGPGMPPAGARPAAGPMGPQALRPAPAPAAAAPRPAAPPAPAPSAPIRKDPFGFGFGAPAPAPAAPKAREEDFGDIEVEPPTRTPAPAPARAAPPSAELDELSVDVEPPAKTPAPIELPDEPEAPAPELAPMHAFVPPADKVGHRPEAAAPSAPAPRDGGEALLREALSKASRDVIERVVWEVVPQLAETIIRENLDRLVKQRQ